MIYLDTNVLVSLFIGDDLSKRAVEWVALCEEQIACSEWARAEFHSVLGLRKRKGELAPADANKAIAAFQASLAVHFAMLPVTDGAAALAATWLQNPDCNLQTGDALHLAIAGKERATTVATFDERFAKAAAKLRLPNIKIVLISNQAHKAKQKRAAYRVPTPKSAEKVGTNSRKTGGLSAVQEKLARLGLTEQDIADAVTWARKKKK